MKIFKCIFIVFFILICSMSGYAQTNNTCPDNAAHPQNDSEESLERYLNSDGFESDKAIFNLPNLQDATIELLTGSNNHCYEINTFKSQNFINVGPDERFAYYKISNYYFIIKWYLLDPGVRTTRPRNITILDEQYNFMFEELY